MGTPIHFVAKSTNRKIGPIPATVLGRGSCPISCAFLKNGCYGDDFYARIHWDKVTSGERDMGLDDVCDRISALPLNQTWRHAVTGDITIDGENVDGDLLERLVRANARRPVIGYTHVDVLKNRRNRSFVKAANDSGFTLNLSANDLEHADQLARLGIAPVVVALPKDSPLRTTTFRDERPVVVCPATYKADVTCATCQLCSRQDRRTIVGFPAHGTSWKKVDFIARRGLALEEAA